MATRKKKEEPVVAKPVVEKVAKTVTKKTKAPPEVWPKVVVGSHLTVTTYENGKTELKWDDEALRREIREATAQFEKSKPAPKRSRKVKEQS